MVIADVNVPPVNVKLVVPVQVVLPDIVNPAEPVIDEPLNVVVPPLLPNDINPEQEIAPDKVIVNGFVPDSVKVVHDIVCAPEKVTPPVIVNAPQVKLSPKVAVIAPVIVNAPNVTVLVVMVPDAFRVQAPTPANRVPEPIVILPDIANVLVLVIVFVYPVVSILLHTEATFIVQFGDVLLNVAILVSFAVGTAPNDQLAVLLKFPAPPVLKIFAAKITLFYKLYVFLRFGCG